MNAALMTFLQKAKGKGAEGLESLGGLEGMGAAAKGVGEKGLGIAAEHPLAAAAGVGAGGALGLAGHEALQEDEGLDLEKLLAMLGIGG